MGVSYFYLFLGCLFWVFLFPFYFIYLIKMKELENLLNKLIEEGRKPFWIELKIKIKIHEWVWFYDDKTIQLEFDCGNMGKYIRLRQIVSAESWLWQFVCKNKLLSDKVDLQDYFEDSYWFRRCPFDTNWMYRIMQSALYSEEDLAKFLFENIRINESLWTAD